MCSSGKHLQAARRQGDHDVLCAQARHGLGRHFGEQGVADVAGFVLSNLDGRTLPEDAKADVANGAKLFAATCMACHGPAGKGNPAMGAPDLTHPGAFIYGSSFAQLQQTIRYGRQGQMPAQEQLQGNDKVHLLAAYVYSLSHGEKRAEEQ